MKAVVGVMYKYRAYSYKHNELACNVLTSTRLYTVFLPDLFLPTVSVTSLRPSVGGCYIFGGVLHKDFSFNEMIFFYNLFAEDARHSIIILISFFLCCLCNFSLLGLPVFGF